MNPRAEAALIVHDVIYKKQSLRTEQVLPRGDQPPNALIQELSYGTLRWYYRLRWIANQLLLSPMPNKHHDIFSLLLVGLYQLMFLRTPTYAAVSETVEAAKQLKKPWATKLLNKTLRKFLIEKETLCALADKDLSAKYAHPLWLIQAIKKAWPDDWQNILFANNSQAPLTIRINPHKTTRDAYMDLLKKNGILADTIPTLLNAIRLKEAISVFKLPHFTQGWCSVQDAAGQHAAILLDCQPGQWVLDACAAPGSKTTHILERTPSLKCLIAIDKDQHRVKKIDDNIKRLALSRSSLQLITTDAANTAEWWDGKLFDRILLDAPCSATGIIRRHPDIKILRTPRDIEQHHETQLRLLNSLWPLLNENGLLLYSTCSVLPKENEMV